MNDAEKHLAQVCKRFAKVIPTHEAFPTKFEKSKDPYRALVRAVVFQQLSGKAATTIHNRVLALFPDKDHPEPEDLLNAPDELLRSAGLSRQKSAALKDIAQKRLDGIIPQSRSLSRLDNEEIIERLTAARGEALRLIEGARMHGGDARLRQQAEIGGEEPGNGAGAHDPPAEWLVLRHAPLPRWR